MSLSASSASATGTKVMFGGNDNLDDQNASVGKLAIVRTYHDSAGTAFPNADETEAFNRGDTVLVSFAPECGGDGQPSCGGSRTGYQDVSQGYEDADITSFLGKVEQAAENRGLDRIYVTFTHEPENSNHQPYGTAAQFVSAWQHVHHLGTLSSPVANHGQGGHVYYVWTLLNGSFSSGTSSSSLSCLPAGAPNVKATDYFPCSGYVDYIGDDTYNWLGCQNGAPDPSKSKTPSALLNDMENWRSSMGLSQQVMLPEWGTPPSTGSYNRPNWIDSMTTYLGNHTGIYDAAMYWDSPGAGQCNFDVDSSPAALSALNDMGDDVNFTRNPQ